MLSWSNSQRAWAERLAGAFALAGVIALVWFHQALSSTQGVLLWGLLGVALAILLRRGWLRLFGPVLFYDALRLARQGRHSVVRTLYAGFLLLMFVTGYVFWLAEHPDSWQDSVLNPSLPAAAIAQFTSVFFQAFLCIQLTVVFLLTPPYLAGAIADERERRTLELLLTTDLHDREILFGLMLARLGNLALVLLAGLPVLSFLQFVGGGDPDMLVAGFVCAGLTMAGLAGLSMVNSLHARKPRQAIVRTYLMTIGYLITSGLSWLLLTPQLGLLNFPSTDDWVSPVTLTDVVVWANTGNIFSLAYQLARGVTGGTPLSVLFPDLLRDYAWFHGVLAVGCCVWAVWRIRAAALQEEAGSDRSTARGRRGRWGHKGLWLLSPPRVGNRPLLWKEVHLEAGGNRGLLGWILLGVPVALLFWPVVQIAYFYGGFSWTAPPERLSELLSVWVRALSMVIGSLMLLQVAVHAAGGISGERDRQTLDGLLATPLSNRNILLSKWLGSILSPRGLATCLGLVWLIGLVTNSLYWLAIPCFLGCWLVLAAFMASLGLFFSVTKKTSLRAAFWTLFAVGGVVLFSALGCHDIPETWLTVNEAWSLFPPLTLGLFAFPHWNLSEYVSGKLEFSLRGIPIWLAFWSLLAALLWWLTSYCFRKEFGRAPGTASLEVSGFPPAASGETTTSRQMRTESESSLPPKPRWVWPRRLAQLAAVLLPLGLLVGFCIVLHHAAVRQLQQAMTETDQLDPGWRFEELEAKRKVIPDERNSALQALKVKPLLPKNFYHEDLSKALENLTPERQLNELQIKLLKAELDRSHAALGEARKLIDMPEGRAVVQYSPDYISTDLSSVQDLRSTANLVALDVLLLAQQGDIDAALGSCRGLLNTGRAIGDEPMFIACLVRVAIQSMAVSRVERCLAQGEPSEPALAALQRLLEDDEREPIALQSVRGERAQMDKFLQRIQEGKATVDAFLDGPVKRPALIRKGASNDLIIVVTGSVTTNRAAFLRLYSDAVEVAKLPEWQQAAALGKLTGQAWSATLLLRLAFPAIRPITDAYRYSRAYLRCAIVTMALERFRRQHGRWPDELAELKPAFLETVPLDPFSGKGIRYRRLADGVVVYCVGADGIDNNGKLDPDRRRTFGTDVGIRLWDPGQRRQPPRSPMPPAKEGEPEP